MPTASPHEHGSESIVPALSDRLESERPDCGDDDALERRAHARRPAIPIAVTFATGIVLDRMCGGSWTVWLIVGAAFWMAWLIARSTTKGREVAVFLLLGCCIAAGGGRHHAMQAVVPETAVERYATDAGRLVRIVGLLQRQPWIKRADPEAWSPGGLRNDRTIAVVACRELHTDDGSVPLSGLVRASVEGHLLHARVGDRVELRGWLRRPPLPGNPAEFDFRNYLKNRGITAMLSIESPDAVRVMATAETYRIRRWFSHWDDRFESLLFRSIAPERLPIAQALLLGNRAEMTDDVRRVFAESGTMHLLAISGLHVAILTAFIWMGCRLCRFSEGSASLIVIVLVIGYALLTDAQPPVVRATIFVVVAAAGRPWFRTGDPGNALGLAALGVLAWHPADLFDVGAQLSFLAVAGIIWCGGWWRILEPRPTDDERWQWLAGWSRRCGRSFGLMASIWLFTLPWAIAHFNLISPVGLVVNVLLSPLILIVLWSGYAMLFVGLLLPELAISMGFVFDTGLACLLGIVDGAASWSFGHRYGPGPETWWLTGYYVLLIGLIAAGRKSRWMRRTAIFLGLWVVIGLAGALRPAATEDFRCTFLSVGHGCAVMLEFPNGSTLLYDAGSLRDGKRAARIVEAALWKTGRVRIDGLLLSHADIDHFNAVPDLLRRVPVGGLFVTRSFFDLEQSAVAELHEVFAASGVRLKYLRADDRLLVQDNVTLRVLHPSGNEAGSDDNANSLVLLIETAGRRILLTGDVEGAGQSALAAFPLRPVDVVMAPHHGSRKANSREFARWAHADWVIASSGHRLDVEKLRTVYGAGAKVLSTGEVGAVTCRIAPTGELRVSWLRGEAR